MDVEGKPKISFLVKKKEEVKQLDPKAIGEETDVGKRKQTDYIVSVEDKKVTSVIPKEEQRELVIPLIKQNRWQISKSAGSHDASPKKRSAEASTDAENEGKKRKGSPTKVESSDSLENEAVQEIMKDVSRYNEEWDTRGIEDRNLTIPLLMQNQVPEGFETDDKLDVSIRPDEATEANYDEVPIEHFGMAMLRGMGWSEKEGIGAKMKANITPIEVNVRPKGQGLGADRRPGDELKQKKKAKRKPGDPAPKEEEEPGGFTKGAPVLVLSGPHKNLYGIIEGVDADSSRVVIKFALSSQPATLSQFAVQRVTKEEYKKSSRDLGKFSKGHEELKRREEEKTRDGSDSEGHRKSRHKDSDDRTSRTHDKHSRRDRKDEKSHRHSQKETREDGYNSTERDADGERRRDGHKHSRKDKHRDRDGYDQTAKRDDDRHRKGDDRHRRKDGDDDRHRQKDEDDLHRQRDDGDKRKRHGNKRREERDEHGSKNQAVDDRESNTGSTTYWLRPDLRVRFINASYKKGKYYNVKVKVVDVITRDTCTCQTDEGRFLEDIHQSMVETLIPKTDPAYVMVVSGKHKGQLGVVLKRDKKKCIADVQLLQDREKIIRLDYDIICEYAGNIQDEEDY